MGLIIDMNMPRSCSTCPAFNYDSDYPTCCLAQKSEGYRFNFREEKMSFCPIKAELPEVHGRLLDEKEVAYAIGSMILDILYKRHEIIIANDVFRCLESVPTVVDAEG